MVEQYATDEIHHYSDLFFVVFVKDSNEVLKSIAVANTHQRTEAARHIAFDQHADALCCNTEQRE